MAHTLLYSTNEAGCPIVIAIVDTTLNNLLSLTKEFCNVYGLEWKRFMISFMDAETIVLEGFKEDVKAFFSFENTDFEFVGETPCPDNVQPSIILRNNEELFTKFLLINGVELYTKLEETGEEVLEGNVVEVVDYGV